MADNAVVVMVTGGGFLATTIAVLRGVFLLGSILESFRQHVKSSDNTHQNMAEEIRYLQRRQ